MPTVIDTSSTLEAPQARRVVLISSGPTKGGRTHFALTAPDPLVYIAFDKGWDGMLHKFNGRIIQKFDHNWVVPSDNVESIMEALKNQNRNALDEVQGKTMRGADAEWDLFKERAWAAVKNPKVRTLVVDTEDYLYMIFRLARFGRAWQVPQSAYNGPKAEYASFWNDLVFRRPDLNVILLTREADEYSPDTKDSQGKTVRGDKTGKKKRQGFADLGYYAFAETRHYMRGYKKKAQFYVDVVNCRSLPRLTGETFEDVDSFSDLMQRMMPDVSPKVWKGATPVPDFSESGE